jgi:hypothetical protein
VASHSIGHDQKLLLTSCHEAHEVLVLLADTPYIAHRDNLAIADSFDGQNWRYVDAISHQGVSPFQGSITGLALVNMAPPSMNQGLVSFMGSV